MLIRYYCVLVLVNFVYGDCERQVYKIPIVDPQCFGQRSIVVSFLIPSTFSALCQWPLPLDFYFYHWHYHLLCFCLYSFITFTFINVILISSPTLKSSPFVWYFPFFPNSIGHSRFLLNDWNWDSFRFLGQQCVRLPGQLWKCQSAQTSYNYKWCHDH